MDIDHGHAAPAEEAMEYDEEVEMGSAGGAEDPEGDEVMMDDDGDEGGGGDEEEYIEADEEEVVPEGEEATAEEVEEEEMEAEEFGGGTESEVNAHNPAEQESQPTALPGGSAPGNVQPATTSESNTIPNPGDGQPVAGPSSPRQNVAGSAQPQDGSHGHHGAHGQAEGEEAGDDEHDDDEEVGEEDEDEGHPDMTDYPYPSDSDTLPPIVVHLPAGDTRSLFFSLPQDSEGSDAPNGAEGKKTPVVWLEGRQAELAEASLADVWAAVRAAYVKEAKAQLGGGADAEVGDLGEMVLDEKLMALKMGEDDVNLQSITLLELVQLYYSCDLPFPLNLELSFQSNRFIARYNAIKSEIDAQADAEADEGGSEVDEEEEGEEGEQAMEPEEPHHSVQRTEIEDVGQPGDEEDSEQLKRSVNMNDPNASEAVPNTAVEREAGPSGAENSTHSGTVDNYEQYEGYDGEDEGNPEAERDGPELPATISAAPASSVDEQSRTLTSEDASAVALGGTPAGPPPAQLDLLGEPPLDEKALRDNRIAIEAASDQPNEYRFDGSGGAMDRADDTSAEAEAEEDAHVGQDEADEADDADTAGDDNDQEGDEPAYNEGQGQDGDEQIIEEQNAEGEEYEPDSENKEAGDDDFLGNIADAALARAEEDAEQQAEDGDAPEDQEEEVTGDSSKPVDADAQEAAAAAEVDIEHAEAVEDEAEALEADVADLADQPSVSIGTAAEIGAKADELAADAKQIEDEAAALPEEDQLVDDDEEAQSPADVAHDGDANGDDELDEEDEGYQTDQDAEGEDAEPEYVHENDGEDVEEPAVTSASKRTFDDDPVVDHEEVPEAKRQKA